MTQNYASIIDHTLLKAETTKEQIEKLCAEAKQFGFASVCVNPAWVKFSSELLQETSVSVCTVIGFPLGANTSAVKVFETKDAIANGANEVDMVINIGELKANNDDFVQAEIAAVVEAAKSNAIVKVIIEACLLTDEEKERACRLSVAAGADFVKTSTGFSTGGATAEDVAIMRKTVGPEIGVKASGGVRNLEDMQKMIEAGANRVGASSSVAIVNGLISDSNY